MSRSKIACSFSHVHVAHVLDACNRHGCAQSASHCCCWWCGVVAVMVLLPLDFFFQLFRMVWPNLFFTASWKSREKSIFTQTCGVHIYANVIIARVDAFARTIAFIGAGRLQTKVYWFHQTFNVHTAHARQRVWGDIKEDGVETGDAIRSYCDLYLSNNYNLTAFSTVGATAAKNVCWF